MPKIYINLIKGLNKKLIIKKILINLFKLII